MKKQNVRWLYDELPSLVDKEIITLENANRIKEYYGDTGEQNWSKLLLTIFGIFGAVFIGVGIISILSTNWDQFSRPLRTVISFLPLIVGQAFSVYVYMKKMDSMTWKECISTFLFLSIGSTISLIAQTYNFSDDFSIFMLCWMLLGLPLLYIFDSTVTGILYLAGITSWMSDKYNHPGDYLFWILLVLVGPYLWKIYKQRPDSSRTAFINWAVGIVGCISISFITELVSFGTWKFIYPAYFCILFLLGTFMHEEDTSLWQKPFVMIGTIGSLVMTYIFTFQTPWNESTFKSNYVFEKDFVFTYVVGALIIAFAVFFMVKTFLRGDKRKLLYPTIFPLSMVAYFLSFYVQDWILWGIFNLFLFIIGVLSVIDGAITKKIAKTNVGMLIISVLIITRFVDSNLPFLIKGISFILVGTGFFISNWFISSKKGANLNEK